MSDQKYLITLQRGNRKHTQVWDGEAPLGLGYPFQYVIESRPEGLRVRDLTGAARTLMTDQVRLVSNKQAHVGTDIDFGSAIIQIRPSRTVTPPYLVRDSQVGTLFAFAGIRRSVLTMQSVHAAYVAYSKSKPIFTVYQSPEGFKIKALMGNVRLKLKGAESESIDVGQLRSLSADEFRQCTITRGWYWWRFSWVNSPTALPTDKYSVAAYDTDAVSERALMRRTGTILGALLLLLIVGSQIYSTLMVEPEIKPEPPQVKLAPKLFKTRVVPVQALPPVAENKPAPQVPVEQPKVKPEAPKAALATPKKQKQAEPERVVRRAPVEKPQPKSDKVALAKANQLKELLGGFAQTVSNKPSTTTTSNQATVPKTFLSGNTSISSPTEIKPVMGGVNAKVTSLGGSGGGAGGSTNGAAIGYGSGAVNASTAKGGSFVSVDFGGSVVEEGLTKEEVGAVVYAHSGEVRYCHEASLLRNPKLEGKTTLEFRIDPNGVVRKVATLASTHSDRKLDECISSRLKTWQFPKPKGGVFVTVSYPFVFKTLRRE